jgi:hypothetical protein
MIRVREPTYEASCLIGCLRHLLLSTCLICPPGRFLQFLLQEARKKPVVVMGMAVGDKNLVRFILYLDFSFYYPCNHFTETFTVQKVEIKMRLSNK